MKFVPVLHFYIYIYKFSSIVPKTDVKSKIPVFGEKLARVFGTDSDQNRIA